MRHRELVGLVLVGAAALWGLTAIRAASPPSAPPARLSPRVSALLAFHEAQDALDVYRMLRAADRLERLGDVPLAACLRSIARQAHQPAFRNEPCSRSPARDPDHKM